MIGLFSKVWVNKFDALAEVPVVGTISSLIRLPVCVLSILYNILKYPVSSHKEECKKNIKASVTGFSRGILEVLPVVGNVVAFYFNKKQCFTNINKEELDSIIHSFGLNIESLSPMEIETYNLAKLERERRQYDLRDLNHLDLSQLKKELEKIRKNQNLTWFDEHKINVIQGKIAELSKDQRTHNTHLR